MPLFPSAASRSPLFAWAFAFCSSWQGDICSLREVARFARSPLARIRELAASLLAFAAQARLYVSPTPFSLSAGEILRGLLGTVGCFGVSWAVSAISRSNFHRVTY